MGWNPVDDRRLRLLARGDRYFLSEIAEKLGRSAQTTRYRARQLRVSSRPPGRMGEWNAKYHFLREPVMRYFLTHTWEETRARFDLTQSELKSIFSVGYRDPKLRHLRKDSRRKDSRRKDSWSLKEVLFLIEHAGLQPRTWIARRLKRGGVHSVKEELERLHCSSKWMNGMPYRWACELLGQDAVHKGVKTKAGPSGGSRADFRYRLIPWVECEELAKSSRVSRDVRLLIRAMARFQRWIYGGNRSAVSRRTIFRKIKENIHGK